MEFRLTGPGDEEVKWLWDYCFEKKEHPFFRWYFSRYSQEGNVLAGYNDGKLSACLHLNPFDLYLRGKTLPVSYIVGLGVMPEARSGVSGDLLRGALAEMRRRRHWISIIMPARAGTYYPYQWELCYHQLRYSVDIGELKTLGAKWGTFRGFNNPQDIAELDSLYRRFVAGRHGYAWRSRDYWSQIVEEHALDNGHIYILENAGQPQGYIFYKLHQGKLLVREMAYTCRSALLALVQFMVQHRSQAKAAEWSAPLDDWLYFLLPDPKGAVTMEPFMSARVVDAAEALAALSYPADVDGSVSFAVEDDLAPWNNRIITLTTSGGKGRISTLSQSPADTVRLSVGALTQLLFGRLSASELLQMGRLHSEMSAPLNLLDRLFPKCNNYINEYY
ncbi:MAG: GNAT family N-acetyltransferase [Negativicutes bacterium]|nr:GNAT family N-acetyltransferase [Negativicutes bacterium]